MNKYRVSMLPMTSTAKLYCAFASVGTKDVYVTAFVPNEAKEKANKAYPNWIANEVWLQIECPKGK